MEFCGVDVIYLLAPGLGFSARGVWVIASVGWVVGLDFGSSQFSWVGFLLRLWGWWLVTGTALWGWVGVWLFVLMVVFLVVVMLCCLGSVARGCGCGCFPWAWWFWVGWCHIDFQVCVVGRFCVFIGCFADGFGIVC